MALKDLLFNVQRIATSEEIDIALIGAMAMSVWGVQRATADVDCLVDGSEKKKVKEAFLRNGFSIIHESEEVLQLVGNGSVVFLFANRAISKNMLAQSKFIDVIKMKCVLPEDIIGLKIQAYNNNAKRRFKDLADIQALIEKNPNMNIEQIKFYADAFSEWETIKTLFGEI